MNCRYPENTASTGYKKGCRCERCRGPQKAWAAERQTRYAGTCGECGARTYGGNKTPPKLCNSCNGKRQGEANRVRALPQRELIEKLWAEGLPAKQIAERVGWNYANPTYGICLARQRGYDLPVRNAACSAANKARWARRAAA